MTQHPLELHIYIQYTNKTNGLSETQGTSIFVSTMPSSFTFLTTIFVLLLLNILPTIASTSSDLKKKDATPSPWNRLNNPQIRHTSPPTASQKSFTITTPPGTDIWRPAPGAAADNFTAPYVYRICKSSDFVRAAVTVSADWQTRYDQGGLAIVFPNSGKKGAAAVKGAKWLKTGLEVENGKPQLGTVGAYAFSDWSLSPVVPAVKGLGKYEARFEIERNGSEFSFSIFSFSFRAFLLRIVVMKFLMGFVLSESWFIWILRLLTNYFRVRSADLWVYNVVKNDRYPLRQATWAFLEERGKKNAEIFVGVYAAKPIFTDGKPDKNLTVEFKNLRIEC